MLNGYEKHKMSTESRRKLNKGESLEVKGDSLEVKENFKTVYPME
jgi:TusA-related sulfurtransferase